LRLLSAVSVLELVEDQASELHMYGFEEPYLQSSWYYIRLGDTVIRPADGIVNSREHIGGAFLNLKAGEFVQVHSYERFRLGPTIKGAVGGVSRLIDSGIELLARPSIDPLFAWDSFEPAPLSFGLRNLNTSAASVRKGDIIARVEFYDVSESDITPRTTIFSGNIRVAEQVSTPTATIRSD
jgi:hypothetical protein